jgi:hypothetical protein
MPATNQTANTTFSNADIQRFYDYLSEQVAPIVLSDSKNYKSVATNPTTIYQAIASFRNNQTIQQNFPAGIADILSPLHLDTFMRLYGPGYESIDPQTVFKMFDHLNIETGIVEFAKSLTGYAYAMHRYGNNNRATLLRLIEEINKDMTPDDNNKVILNNNYIYNVTGRNYPISVLEIEDIKKNLDGLSIQEIQQYIKPSFDTEILPALTEVFEYSWSQDDYRPDAYDDDLALRDKAAILKRELHKHITNSTHADLIYDALVAQTGNTIGRIIYPNDKIEMIKVAIQNTNAGKYDNVTATNSSALTLPTKLQVVVTTETPAITTSVPTGMFSSLSSSNLKILALVGVVAGVGVLAKSIANTLWGKKKGYMAVKTEKTSEAEFDIQRPNV